MTTIFMKPYAYNGDQTKEAYLSALLEMLNNYALRRDSVKQCKNFYEDQPVQWVQNRYPQRNDKGEEVYYVRNLPASVFMCSGNFYRYSYAFCVYTDEPEIIAILKAAIDKNTAREDYLSQPVTEHARYEAVVIDDQIITDWAEALAARDGNIRF